MRVDSVENVVLTRVRCNMERLTLVRGSFRVKIICPYVQRSVYRTLNEGA